MTATPFNDGWSYRRPVGPFAAPGAANDGPIDVRLPHDALRDSARSAGAPGKGSAAYYPHAAFTYLKTFDVPAEWEGRLVRLEVQGAFRRAQVFVNDELLAGNRADGFARFFVDLTPYLLFGADNVLRIEVRAGEDSRWYAGAGLHRPVLLHVDRPLHIVPDGVAVTTVRIEDEQAVVDVVTTVANAGLSSRTTAVTSLVTDPDGRVVEGDSSPVTIAPGEQTSVRHRLYVQRPALWSPDHPALHLATVGLDGDAADVVVPFGIREVTVDPRRGLRINGEPVLLRGACIHSDNGPLGAAAIGRADERRVELLKAAGFNAIRSAHNPASSALLDACDRLGVLVMDEAFDVWSRFKTHNDYATDFPQWWAADLESMVDKDRNHPSVIMYSIGNEIIEVGTPHGARWARRMADHVRSLDPTRLVTNGVNPFLAVIDQIPAILEAAGGGLNQAMGMEGAFSTVGASEAVTRRTDESSAALDVLGLNYSESRYELDQQMFPHRVIVGSETFPVRIGTLWPMVEESPNVIGDFTWTGWDYLGEVGIGATSYREDPSSNGSPEREYPYLSAWCGDIDITGHRRPVSYYREIVFGLRTVPYIAVRRPEHHDHTITMQSPWAWSDSVSTWTWPGHENRAITVEVYADADEVALLLEDEEVARTAVGAERPKLAVMETQYRPGDLTAVAYRDGHEVGRTTLVTASDRVRLAAVPDRAQIRDDAADLAYISIELRDENGNPVPSSDRSVSVSVTGSGVLAGMCSANPKTEERFAAATWNTFDGRLLAVVRPVGAGPIDVTVSSPGLDDVAVHLDVHPLVAHRPSVDPAVAGAVSAPA